MIQATRKKIQNEQMSTELGRFGGGHHGRAARSILGQMFVKINDANCSIRERRIISELIPLGAQI